MYMSFPTFLSNSNFSGKTINDKLLDDGVYYYTLNVLRAPNTNTLENIGVNDFGLFNPVYKLDEKSGYLHVIR